MNDIFGTLIALAFAVAILCATTILIGKLTWPRIEARIQRMFSEALARPTPKRYVDIDAEYRQLVLAEHNKGDN